MRPEVQIKGIREGLLVSLGEGEWADLRESLMQYLRSQSDFFWGARLILDVGKSVLKEAEMGKLRNEISALGLSLWAVLSDSPVTQETTQAHGLATRIHQHIPEPASPEDKRTPADRDALFVQRTLRTGNSIQFPGHVTIFGDVNPGAEITAAGNIIVWGRLNGVAHAGAEGDEAAVVCALDLSPMQLRIAGQTAISPKRRGNPRPEIAQIRAGQVIVEPWVPKQEPPSA